MSHGVVKATAGCFRQLGAGENLNFDRAIASGHAAAVTKTASAYL